MPKRKPRPDDQIVAGLAIHRVPLNSKGEAICGAYSRSARRPCQQKAGHGTDHVGFGTCKFHGGSLAEHKASAARQEVLEFVENKKLLGDIDPDADPDEVMLEEVRRAQAAVQYFDEVVRDMTAEEDHDPAGPRFQKVVWHWNEQRRILANVSSLVIRAGIAKRHVEIQEIQAAAMLGAILHVLNSPEVALTPEQVDMSRRMIATKLRELTTAEEERQVLEVEMVS